MKLPPDKSPAALLFYAVNWYKNHLPERNTKRSLKAHNWMNTLELQNDISIIREHRLKQLKVTVDGYCKETNTVYEYYGSYWHGNLNVYDPEKLHPHFKITFAEVYNKTILRENKIIAAGYNLITEWE